MSFLFLPDYIFLTSPKYYINSATYVGIANYLLEYPVSGVHE
jgi:hypothetical protein